MTNHEYNLHDYWQARQHYLSLKEFHYKTLLGMELSIRKCSSEETEQVRCCFNVVLFHMQLLIVFVLYWLLRTRTSGRFLLTYQQIVPRMALRHLCYILIEVLTN